IIVGLCSMTAVSYILTDVLLPGRSPYLRSLLAASISLNIDLLLDPIAVSTGLWRWTHPSVYVLGVPLTNWVGWFAIVYFFVFAFDTMVINKPLTRKPLLEIRKVEWQKMLTTFLKRLLFLALIVILVNLAVFIFVVYYFNF